MSMLNIDIDILTVLPWRAWNGGYIFCMLLPLGSNTGKSQNMTLQDIQCLGGSGVVNNYHCVEFGHVTRY